MSLKQGKYSLKFSQKNAEMCVNYQTLNINLVSTNCKKNRTKDEAFTYNNANGRRG